MTAIISDIHGNHVALMAVLDELDRLGEKTILCLGDTAGYYCQINECCETLRKRHIFSLMGNHDAYLTTEGRCHRSNAANRCLDYQRGIITDENLAWLASLKPQARVDNLDLVHGGWHDPLEEYLAPVSGYFSTLPGKYFASGHTHVPCIWSDNIKTYCNPGSVGQPRDGDPRASFALWNSERFSLHRVEYDVALIQQKMHDAGFEKYFYENLTVGSRIGGKIDTLPLM